MLTSLIVIASPRYMKKRIPYTKMSLRLLVQERCSSVPVVIRIEFPLPLELIRYRVSERDDRFVAIDFSSDALGDEPQDS